jgi:copper chaperone CopZ
MQIAHFNVAGMTGSGCADIVASAIRAMGGVRSVQVSFENQTATIQYDETLTSPEKLKLAVVSAGYVLQ